MVSPTRGLKGAVCLYLVQLAAQVLAGTQFNSHVSVNTPARSFTHGVGDPVSVFGRRTQRPQQAFTSFRGPPVKSQFRGGGYPRVRPTIPFNNEELPRSNSLITSPPWQNSRKNYADVTIPVLPPSPYKVDSPDPESLWPEGLFLPPISPPRFGLGRRLDNEVDPHDPYLLEGSEAVAAVVRAKNHGELFFHDIPHIEVDPHDPYLLEGSEAVAEVVRAKNHGQLFFHDIPHIESLLANQETRVKNNLKPHVLGSIRHTWQFYRV